ncbi:E3 SUMO-protein ligase pli1 [Coemansia sp. RSA 1200]|nr:E3 SUMO-protein ligase pli1 [Coemansia sp. RSA 1200]
MDIPQQLLTSLRVNDMKNILAYSRSIQKHYTITNCGDKDSHARVLRSLLVTLYDLKKREDYKKVLGCIKYFSEMKTSMFLQYANFEWYDGKKHSIPKDGSWTTFAYYPVVVLSSNGRSVMLPAARQTPTYSPTPTPRTSTPQKSAMGFTSSNLIFAETEFLSPINTIATPAICLESPSKWTSKTFNVRLDVDQLDLLSQDAEGSDLSTHGLYLYMCTYASAADATTGIPKRPISVEYPVKLTVYVNAKAISVADVQKSIVCGQPLNLTEHIYKTTDHPNNISITYSTSGRWVSSLVLAKELSLQAISSEIRKTSFVTAENVRHYFFKASTDSDDDDLISTGALVSLKCPLGLCRIKTPARSKYCQHSQCFDCETFLQIKRRTNTWKCPVCSGAIKSWRELIVDGYFEEILQGTAANDDQVYIESNGDWKKKENANTPKANGGRGTPSSAKGRVLDVDVIDDSAASDSDDLLMQGMHRNKRRRTEIIDLTLDSDSDACNVESDELPPLSQQEIEMVNSIESAIRTSTQTSTGMSQSGQNSRAVDSADQLAGTVTSTPTNKAPTRGSSSVLAVRTAAPVRRMTQTPTRPHRRFQNGRGFPQSASAAMRRLRPARHSAPIPRGSSSTVTLPVTTSVSTSASASAVLQASEAESPVSPRPQPTQSNSGSRLDDVVPNSPRSNPNPVNAEASTLTLPQPNPSSPAQLVNTHGAAQEGVRTEQQQSYYYYYPYTYIPPVQLMPVGGIPYAAYGPSSMQTPPIAARGQSARPGVGSFSTNSPAPPSLSVAPQEKDARWPGVVATTRPLSSPVRSLSAARTPAPKLSTSTSFPVTSTTTPTPSGSTLASTLTTAETTATRAASASTTPSASRSSQLFSAGSSSSGSQGAGVSSTYRLLYMNGEAQSTPGSNVPAADP